jgi:hyperosmotically inducible periplasmic protein
MNARTRMQLLALVAGAALMAAGCGDRSSTETAGQKIDRAADKVAATTDQAAAKAGVAIDDVAITTKVKAAVFAEPGLKSLDINVETRDGVVTLVGTVGSPELKQRATQIAQHVEGVRSVSDQLVVAPG